MFFDASLCGLLIENHYYFLMNTLVNSQSIINCFHLFKKYFIKYLVFVGTVLMLDLSEENLVRISV